MKDIKREIIGLALLLEDVSDLTVFVSYSGHVKDVTVKVYQDYDGADRKSLLYSGFYTDLKHGTDINYTDIKAFLQSKIDEYTVIV